MKEEEAGVGTNDGRVASQPVLEQAVKTPCSHHAGESGTCHLAPEEAEKSLITSAMRGDATAFGELALRHRAGAVRAARSIVGDFLAEDVAQDAMFLAFKSLKSLNDPAKFPAWLGAIVRRLAMRVRNSKYAETAHHSDEDPSKLASPGKAEPTSEGAFCELLAVLEHIPSDYAEALRLHFLEGISLEQIGRSLKIPVSTVKWRIHKGKKALRERLKAQAGPVEGAQEWLHLALRFIPPEWSAVLMEHVVEGVPLDQIASDRGVSLSSLERQLDWARKALREQLIEVGHELARTSGKTPFWNPCEDCALPSACLSAVCTFSPRSLKKARPVDPPAKTR